ncbi:hypothetical protein Mgra_00002412 [Meloidogyne graminicola]|uniref:Probable pectate lyase F n=1 Tax=Meloidogyne graminicola TaxID=189291 RepID=A0A8S9ZYE8_9BILA|nr:hypothetical protein Mgra_00002412 [Meloidogyne graminicola]
MINLIFIILFIQNIYLINCSFGPSYTNTIILNDTKIIDKDFDCEYVRYVQNPKTMGKGDANEFQKPLFEVKNGATLKRCIISGNVGTKGAVDGIHCTGSCTIKDCWNLQVGEDAITLISTNSNSVYNIIGGGAMNARGKVVQFDGAGQLNIDGFYIKNAQIGIRSCGNCDQQFTRKINVKNLKVENLQAGQFIVGVNKNYNDYAVLKNIQILGSSAKSVFVCKVFEGNKVHANPKVLDMEDNKGADGKYCIYGVNDIKYGN